MDIRNDLFEETIMEIVAHSVTIKGTRKAVNQDNYGYSAKTVNGMEAAFSIVCDGVGGLEHGEQASALVVQYYMRWFEDHFSELCDIGSLDIYLESEWNQVLHEAHRKIQNVGETEHIQLGTTVAVLLLLGNNYYAMNVGDTRIYCIADQIRQISKDHTLMQQKLDDGTLSLDEVGKFPRKNVITQCVGIKRDITMSFYKGILKTPSVWLVCSDGYRNKISGKEIGDILNPSRLYEHQDLCEKVDQISRYVLEHNEKDDITAVALWIKDKAGKKLYDTIIRKETKMIFCTKCGSKCNDMDVFCSVCGAPLNGKADNDSDCQTTSFAEQDDDITVISSSDDNDMTIIGSYDDDGTTVILNEQQKERTPVINMPKKEKKVKPEKKKKKEKPVKKKKESSGGPLKIVVYVLGGILVLLLLLIAVSTFF